MRGTQPTNISSTTPVQLLKWLHGYNNDTKISHSGLTTSLLTLRRMNFVWHYLFNCGIGLVDQKSVESILVCRTQVRNLVCNEWCGSALIVYGSASTKFYECGSRSGSRAIKSPNWLVKLCFSPSFYTSGSGSMDRNECGSGSTSLITWTCYLRSMFYFN